MKSRILVIDDEEEICQLLQVALEMAGYQVSYSTSAVKALEMAREESFDLAITDMVMPKMDGFVVLQELQESNPEIFAIVITGLQSGDLFKKALDAGAFAVLSKPFTLADITELIDLGNSIRRPAPSFQILSPYLHQTTKFRVPTALVSTMAIPAYMRDLARALDFPRIVSDRNIPLTVHELIQNSIIHGNQNRENTCISVRAFFSPQVLTIEIEDEGDGFNPRQIGEMQPEYFSKDRGGKGLFLIRWFSDDVCYEKGGRLARVTFQAIRQPKEETLHHATPVGL
ncbi:response regulator [bacterium]|nr:response regulator [bacterium]MBU1936684.1 response regulator [bacterium]